jgi:hypothetical protein
MYTGLFYLQTAVQIALLIWLLRIRARTGAAAATVLLIPQLGLVYDNLIVALGSTIGLGSTLQMLSWPRFWIHWLFGCWLIIGAGSILRLADFRWAQARAAMATFCLITVGLMAYDLPHFWSSQLYPVCEKGLVRYSTAVAAEKFCLPDQVSVKSEFPLAAISTCVVVIIVGIELLRRRRFPWMLVGGVLMFISATPLVARLKLDNLGEVFIAGGCIWAVARFAKPRVLE